MKPKKAIGMIVVVAAILIIGVGCDPGGLFDGQASVPFDLAADAADGVGTRAASGIATFPFAEFTKYEVTVHFVYLALYDPDGNGYSMHTLLNLPDGEGIVVDLTTQKLSEAFGSELAVSGPAGNAIDKIYVGFDPNVVVNGYLYNLDQAGGVYRTSPDGPVVDDEAAPEDWTVTLSGESIPPFSVDESNAPLKTDLSAVYLWLAGGGDLAGHGHTHITVEEDDVFEFRFPLELGVLNWDTGGATEWQAYAELGTPYVQSSTQYYKYYLKPEGSEYYTDMIRILTDADGKMILGQLTGSPFDMDNENRIFHSQFDVWYEADGAADNSYYETLYSINEDGTINFQTDVSDEHSQDVSVSSFDLLSAAGDTGTATFTVDGTDVVAEYIRVE